MGDINSFEKTEKKFKAVMDAVHANPNAKI